MTEKKIVKGWVARYMHPNGEYGDSFFFDTKDEAYHEMIYNPEKYRKFGEHPVGGVVCDPLYELIDAEEHTNKLSISTSDAGFAVHLLNAHKSRSFVVQKDVDMIIYSFNQSGVTLALPVIKSESTLNKSKEMITAFADQNPACEIQLWPEDYTSGAK